MKLLGCILLKLGKLGHKSGEIAEVRVHIKDALRIFRRLREEALIADALAALGNVELQGLQFGPARKHLGEAREYYQGRGATALVEEIDELLAIAGGN